MKREKHVLCSVLGFYGLTATSGAKVALIESLKGWFEERECPVHKIAVTGDGWSGRPVKFHTVQRRIHVQAHEIEGFSMFSLLPGPVDLMMNAKLQAEFSFQANEKSWGVIESRPDISDIPSEHAMEVVRMILFTLKPKYGIGFQRPLASGPSMCAIGMPFRPDLSPEGRREAESIEAWRRIGMRKQVYNDGVLRGVYPWNFLNRQHLAAKIDKQDLQTWIATDKRRGRLTFLDAELARWDRRSVSGSLGEAVGCGRDHFQ